MLHKTRVALAVLAGAVLLAGSVQGDDLTASLKQGVPDLKSAGPLAFGPEGILFVGDTQGAAIFAIDTGDRSPSAAAGPLNVKGIDGFFVTVPATTEKDI